MTSTVYHIRNGIANAISCLRLNSAEKFYGEKKAAIGKVLRQLCEWKGVKIIEAEACPDHIHLFAACTSRFVSKTWWTCGVSSAIMSAWSDSGMSDRFIFTGVAVLTLACAGIQPSVTAETYQIAKQKKRVLG